MGHSFARVRFKLRLKRRKREAERLAKKDTAPAPTKAAAKK
jgi:hypothetical protein